MSREPLRIHVECSKRQILSAPTDEIVVSLDFSIICSFSEAVLSTSTGEISSIYIIYAFSILPLYNMISQGVWRSLRCLKQRKRLLLYVQIHISLLELLPLLILNLYTASQFFNNITDYLVSIKLYRDDTTSICHSVVERLLLITLKSRKAINPFIVSAESLSASISCAFLILKKFGNISSTKIWKII